MNFQGQYPPDWKLIAHRVKEAAGWRCIRCHEPNNKQSGHVLTVHHMDGDKSNCEWWNLLALCQRCHLSVQAKLDPQIPFFLPHSDWIRPYVAGFYALKYHGELLSRVEVETQIEDLLALELAVTANP